MTQSELFRLAKKIKRHHASFTPIPAYVEMKRPIGKWSGIAYQFERDFQKREQLEPDCNLGLLVANDYIIIDVDAKPPASKSNNKRYLENTGVADFAALVALNEPLPPTLTVKRLPVVNTTILRLLAGGYVMIPPSKKGVKRYLWETNDDYRTPMAPLPQWIMNNIHVTLQKQPRHFEAQEFTCNPSVNEDISDADVALFKDSEYWQPCFSIKASPDPYGRYIVTASQPYNCGICEREHVNNTNHPFLVRNNGTLRFVCRPGKEFNRMIDRDYLKMWNDFKPAYIKNLVTNGDITNRAVSASLQQELKDNMFPTLKPNMWLMFDEETGIWREEHKDVLLHPLFDKYVKHLNNLSFICSGLKSDDDDIWNQHLSTCKSLMYSCSMVSKKKDHSQALFELIRDNRKERFFNKSKHLLHCSNDVVDLNTGDFKKAKVTDYSTMSTNIPYLEYDKHPQKKRDLVDKFLDDFTVGDQEVKHYLLKVLASVISGNNLDQQFYMLHGEGANAKSLLIRMLKAALGNYAAPIPSAQVTKPSMDAQSASPALVALQYIRAACLTDLNDRVLFPEFLKMLAGGDSIAGRQLFQEQKTLDLWCKIIIAVNDLPEIRDRTLGFWRKLVLIPCRASFSMNPDPSKPEQKQIVEGFEEHLLQCADTFLALLVKVYLTAYKTEGVKDNAKPECIKRLVLEYQESQDIPLAFMNTMIAEGTADAVLTTKALDTAFSEYLRDKGVTKNVALVRHLYEKIDKKYPPSNSCRQIRLGEKNIRGWRGIYIRPDYEGIEEEEDHVAEEVDREFLRGQWVSRVL
ncbi:hypothetical protein BC832DRAFT_594826 [Gaertneriomyces semiglobifer]|nr:hypothetical protein BC832DRAFT_594826 [Gaertneriomyces semiglobifer]